MHVADQHFGAVPETSERTTVVVESKSFAFTPIAWRRHSRTGGSRLSATVLGHRERPQLPGRRLHRRRVVAKGARAGQRRRVELRPGTAVRRVPILSAVQGPVAVPPHLHMRVVLREAGDVPDVP